MFVMSVCMCRVEKTAQALVRWQAESLYIQSSLVNKMWLWAKTGNWHPHWIADVTQIMYPLLREMIPRPSLLANRNNLLPLKSWGITDSAWPPPMPTDDLHVNAVLIHWLVGRMCCAEPTAPQYKVSPPYIPLSRKYIHCMAPLCGGLTPLFSTPVVKEKNVFIPQINVVLTVLLYN